MERISISLPENMVIMLKQRADSKCTSISQYIRELIDFSLRIEEKSDEKIGYGDQKIGDISLKELWKNQLYWLLETRLLNRFIVENFPQCSKEESMKMLALCKEKSIAYVDGLLKDLD